MQRLGEREVMTYEFSICSKVLEGLSTGFNRERETEREREREREGFVLLK